MEADRPPEQLFSAPLGLGRLGDEDRPAVRGRKAFFGDRQQPAVVEGPVGETDQRFAAAAVVPAEHGRRQVLGGVVEEAVAGQVVLHHLAGLPRSAVPLPRRRFAGPRRNRSAEAASRRRPRSPAGAEDRGHRLFQRDLAGLVENDHVEIGRVHGERVGDAQGAHQPDRLQVLDHRRRNRRRRDRGSTCNASTCRTRAPGRAGRGCTAS